MQTVGRNKLVGKTLEDAFFYRMDQELIAELRKKIDLEEKLDAFQNVTGIRNRQQLLALIDAGFEIATLTAFTWVPLVFVAWADGVIDEDEKKVISDTLISKGIAPETAAMMANHEWFARRPDEELWNIWQQFARNTLEQQPLAVQNELLDEVVTLCHVVANASGNSVSDSDISDAEWKVIDRVAVSLCGQSLTRT